MAIAAARGRMAAQQNWQRLFGSVAARSIATTSTTSTASTGFGSHPAAAAADEEPPIVKPQTRNKLLVLGGSGFVGSHVCIEALHRGLPVVSLSRSGRPPDAAASWAHDVVWIRGDVLDPSPWQDSLQEVQAVVSCIGGFGTNAQMRRINGEANCAAVEAAASAGVKRFVYISAADFGLPPFVLQGYYEGKRMAEEAVRQKFPYSGVILRPGFIYGTRTIVGVQIPLSVIFSPLEMILKQAKAAAQIPLVGSLLIPPVNVKTVAKAAVKAAVGPVPPGVLDVWAIMRLGDH